MSIKLYAKCAGTGFPVVLLHGLFGAGSNLGALSRHLQDSFHVCSIDMPNHGRSGWLEAVDIPSMADCLTQWMAQEGVSSAHWVGHSLGGKVAMQLALKNPALVASLVVADIAPVAYGGRHDRVFAALEAVAQGNCSSREEASSLMQRHLEEAGVIQFLMKSLQRDEQGFFRWRLDLEGLRSNYAKLSAAPVVEEPYGGQVQFIKGSESDYIQQHHWPEIERLFPRAEIKVMADCGHWLHAEKPELFNGIVGRFLQAQVSAGAS
ncbi:MAG: esterase [Halioglobus sp.]|jgi:esterase